jgi:hypothetical protein
MRGYALAVMAPAGRERLPVLAKEGSAPPSPPAADTESRSGTRLREERVVRCRDCGHTLARERDRLPLETSTFVNPEGVVYEIAAFGEAAGCAVGGQPTTFWTWFPGHAWRYALCGKCGVHLGWAFSGASRFFGLLTERIAG